jgi:uncharacterized OB-fold protein
MTYLPPGLPIPTVEDGGLDAPFWEGARDHRLMVQHCDHCQTFQWGPEWICHACHADNVAWTQIEGKGRIYSWERVWHPTSPAMAEKVPYLIVLVELPHAGNIRMLGNLLGDPKQEVPFGAEVEAVFEDHATPSGKYTLVQWRIAGSGAS